MLKNVHGIPPSVLIINAHHKTHMEWPPCVLKLATQKTHMEWPPSVVKLAHTQKAYMELKKNTWNGPVSLLK